MYSLLCKKRTVYFHWRKSVKSLHNSLVGKLHGFLNSFTFYHLSSHTAGCYCGTAAEGFEFAVSDNMCLVINIQENSHNIAAFGISYCTDTACILYFSNITWMLEMIHYFLTIHLFFLLASVLIKFFIFFNYSAGTIPRGVFCERSSQKTRECRREIMQSMISVHREACNCEDTEQLLFFYKIFI